LTVVVVTIAAVALVVNFRVTPHVQKGRLATIKPARTPRRAPTSTAQRPGRPAVSRKPVTRRITGTAVMTNYGPVQVRLTMRGSRIVSITNLALPFDRSEALAAQSARIDVVSGATYTSNGYAQSLQSALDRAHA
jgi:uncharacterized protein with FMN-binding domain